MKRSTRLIIEHGYHLIFIKRTKIIDGKKKEFYTLPGGNVDENETWEEAGIREAREELNVEVELESLLTEEVNEAVDKVERFYFAKIISGTISPGKGEEFSNPDEEKYGKYEIAKIKKSELGAYNILPESVKDMLVATYV